MAEPGTVEVHGDDGNVWANFAHNVKPLAKGFTDEEIVTLLSAVRKGIDAGFIDTEAGHSVKEKIEYSYRLRGLGNAVDYIRRAES